MRISQAIARNRVVAGRRPATQFQGRTRTWAEHTDRVARLAGAIRGLGVAEGDRVAMLALNSDRYLEWFHGVSWAGAVFVPINTRLAYPEIVHWLTDSGSSMLFVDDEFAHLTSRLQGDTPALRRVCLVGDGPPPDGLHGFEQLIGSSAPIEPSPRGDDDLAGLFYTGGTTGTSKGVMLSHRNLLTNALQIVGLCGYTAESVYLHAAPMFHLANGLGMFLVGLVGATSVVVPKFDPAVVIRAVEEHGVTDTVMVPTMINMVAHDPATDTADLSSWRSLLYGGSPMTEAGIEAIRKAVPTLRLIQTYGQTEASPVVTLLPDERHVFSGPLAGKIRSAGQPVYGVTVATLDRPGHPTAIGEVGEICVQADTVMLGYHNRPEETATALRDGWLHTGDAGYLDDEGFLFVVDRVKDMIISGGENVYSAEVENALARHPSVMECAVFGIPNERWGEQVHAVVRVEPGAAATEQELLSHCRELIAAYKCPRSIEVTNGELPKSGAGKVLKQRLRAPHWRGLDRAVT